MINEEKLKELLNILINDYYNHSPHYRKLIEDKLEEVFEKWIENKFG